MVVGTEAGTERLAAFLIPTASPLWAMVRVDMEAARRMPTGAMVVEEDTTKHIAPVF